MRNAAADLEFEEAARLRDEIRRLEAMELEMKPEGGAYGFEEEATPYRAGPAPRPRSKAGAANSPRGRRRPHKKR